MKNKYIILFLFFLISSTVFSQMPLVTVNVPAPLPACNPGDCSDLFAVFPALEQTNNYSVAPKTYNPTFPTTGGTLLDASADDVWSPVVNLPFSFNFYGVTYNKVIVGSNGVISFNITNAGGFCPWAYTGGIPSTTFPIRNAIYGVYQDTDVRSPPVTNPVLQNVNYYVLDTGVNAAPNRVFVANWNELPQFSCNTGVGLQTSQIAIHEGTNIIDILVNKRSCCAGWNSGNGIIGVQNAAGTLATVATTRNSGCWNTTNEGWQITPAGPTNVPVTIRWEQGVSPSNVPIGTLNQNPLNVCPTGSTSYTAIVEYTNPDNTKFSVRKTVVVDIATPLPVSSPQDITICSASGPPYTVDINQNAYILSGVTSPSDYVIKYYEDPIDAANGAPTSINHVDDTALSTYTFNTAPPKTIYVRLEDLVTTGCYNVRSFVINIGAPSGTISYDANPYCNNLATPQPVTNHSLTSGGTYSSTSSGLNIDPVTGAINSGSTVGSYVVKYEIAASGACPLYSTTANVDIVACTCSVIASSTSETLCANTILSPITYTVSGGATGGSVTSGALPPGVTGSFSGGTFTVSGVPSTFGTYTYTVSMTSGLDTCSLATTIDVKSLPTASISGTATVCSGTMGTVTFTGTANATVNYNVGSGPVMNILLNASGTASLTTPVLTTSITYTILSVASNGTPNCSQPLTGTAVFTIKTLPTASISGTATICSGTTTGITFSGTPNATVSYKIDSGPDQTISLNASGTASIVTPTLTVDSTYSLISVASNGTPNCSQPQTGSAIVTVNPLPTASVAANAICSGATGAVTFTGTANATVTYKVGSGPNVTILLDATGTAIFTTPALTANSTYTLVSVASNGTPNCSQSQTGSATVTVNPLPTATISGSAMICSGTSGTISFNGTPNAIVTYKIDGGPDQTALINASGTASVASLVLTADSTYTLVSVASTNPNCSQLQSGSATLTVKGLPTATISGTTTICSGTTATITFSGTANATVTYKVDAEPDQTISLDTTGSATVTTPTLTVDSTYTLMSVASNGIPNCSQPQTGSVTITVNSLPIVTISGSATICSGTTGTITFNGTPNASVTYTVDGGANQTTLLDAFGEANLTTPSLTTNSTYVLVSVTSGTPSCSQLQSGSAVISIKMLPTASISGTTTICSGTTAIITFNGTANASVTYTVNAGSPQVTILNGLGTATITTSALMADTNYTLVNVATNGTPNCSQPQTGSAVITVKNLPVASITGSTICSGTTGTVTFSGTANATVTYTVNAGPNQNVLLDGVGAATITTLVLTTNSTYTLISVASNGTPNCSQLQTGSAMVTVRPLPSIVLVPPAAPSVCVNSAIANIKYTIGGSATGATVSGLPTGVTGSLAGTSFVISGTPTQSGNFPYMVKTTGGCSPDATLNGTITVNPAATITLAGDNDQEICINTPITSITYTLGNGATGASITSGGLPSGVNGVYNAVAGTFTISGTGTSVGDFNYVINTTGGCPSVSKSGHIKVNPKVGIVLNSAADTPFKTYCINDLILPIKYLIQNGATGAVATGLPLSLTQSFNSSNNVLTISGNVTITGTYNFTVSTTGGCGPAASLNGSLILNPTVTIALSSSPPAAVCINDLFTNVTYTVNNGATGAVLSGTVPTGIQGAFSGGVYTIKGTPTQAGAFNYTVTTIGGCGTAALSGTINVRSLPVIALEQNAFICVDETGAPKAGSTYTLSTGLNTPAYSFIWSDASGVISGQSAGNYMATAPGIYSVNVTNNSTGCSSVGTATVVPSLPPVAIFASASTYFSEDQVVTVSVTPVGIYEYQLDGGIWQDGSQFTNLNSGTHEIKVRDKFGCGIINTSVRIIDYPKFFTPNGDGYNDIWNISDLSDQSECTIYIFDRYGKLLKQITPFGAGWDGTFNAQILPASDYWFKIFFQESGVQKEFKAHFSLKR